MSKNLIIALIINKLSMLSVSLYVNRAERENLSPFGQKWVDELIASRQEAYDKLMDILQTEYGVIPEKKIVCGLPVFHELEYIKRLTPEEFEIHQYAIEMMTR